MFKYILPLLFIANIAFASDWFISANSPFTDSTVSGVQCRYLRLDSTDLATEYSPALDTRLIANAEFVYTINNSATGSGADVTLQVCTNDSDTGTCTAFQADVNGDFISTDAALTADADFLAATQSYIRALVDTAAVSPGNSTLKVCGSTSDIPMTEVDPVFTASGLTDGSNADGLHSHTASASTQQAISANATTGLFDGGEITINAVPSTFDLAAGTGAVVDWTDPLNPVYNEVSWDEQLGITVTGLATETFTTLGINSSGVLVQNPGVPFTPQLRRSLITLQVLQHLNNTIIDAVTVNSIPAYEVTRSILDYIEVLGAINKGNGYTFNGANRQVDKVPGVTTLPFVNRGIDLQDPTNKTDGQQVAISTLIRNWQDGSGGVTVLSGQSFLDPDFYDDGSGTLAAVGGNKWQIQRFYFFSPSGATIVAYGQATYNSLSEARNAIFTEVFVENPRVAAGKFTTAVLLKNGVTELNDPDEAEFVSITIGAANAGTFNPNDSVPVDHANFDAEVDAIVLTHTNIPDAHHLATPTEFEIAGTMPILWFNETDQAVDNKLWRLESQNSSFIFSAFDDARTLGGIVFTISRTDTIIDSISFSPTVFFRDGSASDPSISFDTDVDTGFFLSSGDINYTNDGVDLGKLATRGLGFADEVSYFIVDSSEIDSLPQTNVSAYPISQGGWNFIDPNTVQSIILTPCSTTNPCIIGADDAYPNTPTNQIMEDWASAGPLGPWVDAGDHSQGRTGIPCTVALPQTHDNGCVYEGLGFDTYSTGAATASQSSIVGSDDTIVNAQLSTAVGSRHSKISAVNGTTGHLTVIGSTSAFIAGETQYSGIILTHDGSIIGTDSDSGGKTTNEAIFGGDGNLIDMHGVVGNAVAGRNTILNGVSNSIITDVAGDRGCSECAILNSRSSTIRNEGIALNTEIQGAIIIGGRGNEIIGIAGEKPPIGALVTGAYGTAWMPHQKVHGSGPGYDSGDTIPGALQTIDMMFRKKTTEDNAAQGMNPSSAGSDLSLQYAGVYIITGKGQCTDSADITTTAPTQIEMWDVVASMWWTGGAATPQVIGVADGGDDLTPGTQLFLPTVYTFGAVNTWAMQITTGTNGRFRFRINPGADAQELFCWVDAHISMSRQDSGP